MAEISTSKRATSAGDELLPLSEYEGGWKTRSFLADPTRTFPEVLAFRCVERPGDAVFHEIVVGPAGEMDARELTLGRLDERIGHAAACLDAAGVIAGDRVLLCLQSAELFASFFLGAQALGAIPVPLPSVSDGQRPAALQERIAAVALDCMPRAIIADDADALNVVGAGVKNNVSMVDGGRIRSEPTPPRPATFSLRRSFRELAFIQYTSGSTGKPKGVVVTHYNLVANLRAIAEAGAFSAADRSVFWLPLYHDMGLVGGLLFGIYLGIPTYVMAPRAFVSRPDSWLHAITRWKGTFTIAPNFAYNLLSGRLPRTALAGIDLSSLRLAFNGAEPIDKSTVDAFINRFEPFGFHPTSFYPVYGMAEATLAAAFPTPGNRVRCDIVDRETLASSGMAIPTPSGSPRAVTFVSVGHAMPGHQLLIRSPDAADELPERRVGEVVVIGPSISPRYYRSTEDTAARAELRTGDLGYIADGEVYIVDRLKDLVIVAGRNIIPSDVERVAAGVEGVRYGAVAVFARPTADGTDGLYVVAGIESNARPNAVETRARVRARVLEYFGVSPVDVVLVEPRTVPKTSSGKIRRAACRQLYETGEFAARGEPGQPGGRPETSR